MAVSNGIFTMKAVNDETNSDLFSQLGGLLGVAKRSDGRYHLADLCSAGSINAFARNHPFAYNSDNFDYDPNNPSEGNARREAAKASVRFGFSRPQLFTITSNDLSHAPYVYNPPKGRAQGEPFRIRDFDGYKHDVTAPIAHDFNNNRTDNKIIREDAWLVYVNFPTDTYRVKVTDIVPQDIKNFNFCLVIVKASTGQSWVLPFNKKVKDYTTPFVIPVVPDSSHTDLINTQGATIWSEMAHYGNEGQNYIVAVGITPAAPKSDHTPYDWTDVYSLELEQGKDRSTMLMATKMGLDDLTGYLNTTWLSVTKDTSSSVDGNTNLGIIKPSSSQKLTVRLTTGNDWLRSACYISVKISNLYGPIIHNGTVNYNQTITVGEDVTIGRNQSIDVDILSYWHSDNEIWFAYPKTNGTTTVQFEIRAWYNSEMSGPNKLIGTFSKTF